MEYKTVRSAAEAEFVEKRSRFIGYAAPVASAEEAAAFIMKIKSKHWDARHNVSAYVLREGGLCRYSDDGEPQGTAGKPVLGVIEKSGLVDCAVVVTRYFGGILLGAGGLVRAYSHAASLALEAAGAVTRDMCEDLRVRCDYNFYGRLSSLVPECGGTVLDSRFEDEVEMDFFMPAHEVPAFSVKLRDLSSGALAPEKLGERYRDID